MLYVPVSFVLTIRVSPLSICLAVTLTPGNTAPVGSRTMPDIDAEKFWPHTSALASAITPGIPSTSVTKLLRPLSLRPTITPLFLRRH